MNGFSIFEICFFIFISSVLALISIPSILHLIERQSLEAAVLTWISHIHEAQTLALATHEVIVFRPQKSEGWNQTTLIQNKNQVLKNFLPIGDKFKIDWKGFPVYQPYLVFTEQGLLENENGTFTVCLKNQCEHVVIAKSGRVRVTTSVSLPLR